jgi:hypothetical protein
MLAISKLPALGKPDGRLFSLISRTVVMAFRLHSDPDGPFKQLFSSARRVASRAMT